MPSVTALATRLAASVSDPFLLTNDPSSTGRLYIGRNGALSPTNYDNYLDPGDQWIVEGTGDEVWVVTDAGSTVTCTQNYNTRNVVSRAPSEISLRSAVTQIASGTVAVQPAGVLATILDTTDLDLYQSLHLVFGNSSSYAGVNTLTLCRVYIEQMDLLGNVIKTESPYFLTTGRLEYTTAIVAPRVRVSLAQTLSAVPLSVPYLIFGCAAILPHRYYQFPGNTAKFVGTADSGSLFLTDSKFVSMFTNTPVGTGFIYPDTLGGKAFMEAVNALAAARTVRYNMSPLVTLDERQANWVSDLLNAAYAHDEETVLIPECPVQVRVINSGAAAAQTALQITWE